MASYRKRKCSWRAEVARNGVRISASFDTKAEAVAWATDKESEIFNHNPTERKNTNKTLVDAINKYLAEILPTKHQRTYAWNCKKLAFFKKDMDFCGELIHKINDSQISVWMKERAKKVKSSTVNRDLNLLSSIFETACRDWKWISKNPVHEIRRPKNPRPRDRLITPFEVKKILEELMYQEGCAPQMTKQYIAFAFLLAIETGMRHSEIFGLVWDRVYFDLRYIHLPDSKNGDRRDVPLSTRAIELLKVLSKNADDSRCFPVNPSSAETLWRRALKNTGIVDLHFHDTRHQAITNLSKKLDVLALARTVGQRDLKSLMIYYNETATELASRLD